MNPASLQALIIDRYFGELTPEVVELLDVYLAQNPTARAEADIVLGTLDLARKTVQAHPELAPKGEPIHSESARPRGRHPLLTSGWLRAAALLILVAVTSAGVFLASSRKVPAPHQSATPILAQIPDSARRAASPWAQYRLSRDPGGVALQVRRIETAIAKKEGSFAP